MKLLLFFLIFSIQCFSNSFNDFDHFQKQLSKEYVTQKIARYLQYSNEIEGYYEVSEEAFILFASPEDKQKGIPEYRLFFGNNTPETNLKLNQPLNRSKIAIDPGHFGGKFAHLEKRYVEMEHEGNMLVFDEGTLSKQKRQLICFKDVMRPGKHPAEQFSHCLHDKFSNSAVFRKYV